MVDFWSQVEKQLSPRYVHPYETLADTPYIVDATATVGKGSYGTVQKFNHRRGGEPLAIKTVHKIFSDEDARKVLREIGVLEVCHHKNIIQLVEAFTLEEDDQSMHLVIIPWAPCTLESFLHLNDTKRQNRCPWFEPGSLKSDRSIYRIMYELADAVSYLHGRSIKHKDLKPENILLYREGTSQVTPLITDFGVSKIYMLNAKTNYQDSTYIYLAPEQHNMKASTLESDIWQLGCCFAELLAVAKGGTSTYRKLGDNSFRREGSSWCIAGEHGQFMKALAEICIPSNATLKRAYVITAGMLALDPADRLDIEVVKTAF
jgi:serine/threonine protein kinase